MKVSWYIVNKEWNTVEGPFEDARCAENAQKNKFDGCCWILVPSLNIPYPQVES